MNIIILHVLGILACIALKFALVLLMVNKASTITGYMKALQGAAKRFDLFFDPTSGYISSKLTGDSAKFRPYLPSRKVFTINFIVLSAIFGWLNTPILIKNIIEVIRYPRDIKLWTEEVAKSIIQRTETLKTCGPDFVCSQLIEVCKSRDEEGKGQDQIVADLIQKHFDRMIIPLSIEIPVPQGAV